MTTTELLTTWDRDPIVLALCVAALVGYGVVLHRQPRGRRGYLAAAGASVMFVVAVASPIGVLSRGYLFSAHMLQHLMLVLVVPPLALLSLSRQQSPSVRGRLTSGASLPRWTLGIGAMWLWHAPTLCDAASRSAAVHHLQTLSLIAMGTAFWWPILAPRAERRLAPLGAMVYLFTACLACTMLGVLVTFSPVEVCSVYAHPVDQLGVLPLLRGGWGLTPKVDQEIGGLLMWVPACFGYGFGILAMLGRYYAEGDAPHLAKEEA
jgi:cytochrome c oxidase assembly factor CtaG